MTQRRGEEIPKLESFGLDGFASDIAVLKDRMNQLEGVKLPQLQDRLDQRITSILERLEQKTGWSERLLDTKLTAIEKQLAITIDSQAQNHNQLRELIDLAKSEFHMSVENNRAQFTATFERMRQDGQIAREKYDAEIRTLREGRSSDRAAMAGRQAGAQPYVGIAVAIITALLTAAMFTFLTSPRESSQPAPVRQTQQTK